VSTVIAVRHRSWGTVAVLVAATVLVALAVVVTLERHSDVRSDELGPVDLIEVIGGDPDLVATTVARAGGEVVELLEPAATRTETITRARFDRVGDRHDQRTVIAQLESEGLTARPARVISGW
jgi:hypothetical protein